jgi:uncharacterized protein YkwD
LVATSSVIASEPGRDDADLQAKVVDEINFARSRPQDYIAGLVAYRSTIEGNYALKTVIGENGPYTVRTRLSEGVSAVDKAIAFLKRQGPTPPLASDEALLEAARRFADEQSRSGKWGHTSDDGSSLSDRIRQAGTRKNYNAETIMYGKTTPHDIVMHLIIDDGVSDRSHRDVIFDRNLVLVGTVCRPHPKWTICVSEYSSNEPSGARKNRAGPVSGPSQSLARKSWVPEPARDDTSL